MLCNRLLRAVRSCTADGRRTRQRIQAVVRGTWRRPTPGRGESSSLIRRPGGDSSLGPHLCTAGAGAARTGTDDATFLGRVATVRRYALSADSEFGVQQLDGGAFQCSLLLERAPDQLDVTYSARAGGDFEMRLRSRLGDHAISTVRDLRARFIDLSDWHHVIYLNLLTSAFADEPLTPTALQQIAAFLGKDAHAIAMIDREAIIRGDRGPDWLRVFFRDQWTGLIAVESDITAKALKFHGFRFLTELLSRGVPLAESLHDIRRTLWPYSLLYGVYSNPDRVFVAPPPGIVDEMKAILREEGEAHS